MICVGDVVVTSYNTGPYEALKVTETPDGISLRCKLAPQDGEELPRELQEKRYWLNSIYVEGDRYLIKYIARKDDEIFIVKKADKPVQLKLF